MKGMMGAISGAVIGLVLNYFNRRAAIGLKGAACGMRSWKIIGEAN